MTVWEIRRFKLHFWKKANVGYFYECPITGILSRRTVRVNHKVELL